METLYSATGNISSISSENLYLTLTNALPHIAVVVFDSSLRCRLVSGSASDLLNLSAPLINGQTVEEIFSWIAPQFQTYGQESLKGTENRFELALDGRILQVRVVPVFDEQRVAKAGMFIFEENRAQIPDETTLQTLIESAPDAMIIVDSGGMIILANVEAEHLFGYSRDELLGKPVEILLPSGFRQSHQRSVRGFVGNPRPRKLGAGLDLIALRNDGTEFPVDISLRPIHTPRGMIIVSAIRDITTQKQLEDSLRQASEELEARVVKRTAQLEARNEELDAFAQTVAHDLKNPLALVTGMAEMLLQHRDSLSDDELEKYLAAILRDGRKLGRIIDDLMVLSTVRYTQPQLDVVDVHQRASAVVKQLDALLQQFDADVSISNDWPVAVGYGPWIETVWVNYLSNAVKYGGTPPVIRLGATSQPDGMVRFWIADNGDGLATDEQERLFLEFTRLSMRRVDGYGLGLSIVRRVVERLGGQVGVESSPGQGSTFYFTLPAGR